MSFLVTYKVNNEEIKELINDSESAAKFIEGLLKDQAINEEAIKLYRLEAVDYGVERVPVVKLEAASTSAQPESPSNQNDEQFANQIKDVDDSKDDENIEVFTFDS